MAHDTIRFMPRPALRKQSPEELPDVPDEILGFPERLTLARTIRKLAPSETGTSRQERGIRVRGMTALWLVRVASSLGVRVAWLLTGEEPMWLPGREPSPPAVPQSFDHSEE